MHPKGTHVAPWSNDCITDPAHDAARKARAQLLELPVAGPDTGVEQRDLADYDRLLGVA